MNFLIKIIIIVGPLILLFVFCVDRVFCDMFFCVERIGCVLSVFFILVFFVGIVVRPWVCV